MLTFEHPDLPKLIVYYILQAYNFRAMLILLVNARAMLLEQKDYEDHQGIVDTKHHIVTNFI